MADKGLMYIIVNDIVMITVIRRGITVGTPHDSLAKS